MELRLDKRIPGRLKLDQRRFDVIADTFFFVFFLFSAEIE